MDNAKRNPIPLWTRIRQFFGTHTCTLFYQFAGAAAILLYLIGYYVKIPTCMTVGTHFFFGGILIYLAHWNYRKIFSFLHQNSNISHLPERQIRLMNLLFLLFFLFMTSLAMMVLPFLPYREFVSSIGTLLLNVIRFLIALVYHPRAKEVLPETLSEETPDLLSLFPKNTQAPNEILRFLANLLVYLLALVFFIIVVYQLICVIYYKLLEWRDRKQKIYSDTFSTPLEHHERLSRPRSNEARLKWNDFTPNGRIRKRYKKTIQNGLARSSSAEHISHSALTSATPSELEQMAGLTESTEIQLLHERYEKARYSKDGCSRKGLP